MRLQIFPSKLELGRAAAREAADSIRDAVAARGKARIIAATGASQFEFLDALTGTSSRCSTSMNTSASPPIIRRASGATCRNA
jgi:6-phosphogluconolactonase/glucosamine-6-phosphate isomerase/deaminase